MDLRYVNSRGIELNLTQWPYMYSSGDIYDFMWSYEMASGNSNRITEFYKAPLEMPIKISITADTEEEFSNAVNHLFETTEVDIIDLTPGKLYLGDMYMKCYIRGIKKAKFNAGIEFMLSELNIIAEKPCWIKEKKIAYVKREPVPNGFLDYPYDYSYDYTPNNINCVELENEEVEACDFKAVIQGPCMNPGFYIGSQNYQIMTELSSYEYIVLDSMTRTVYKVSRTGRVENIWNNLNKEYDNFAKIPTGVHIMEAYDKFPFEITLYERRSEPKWS
ncbi:hypothetical protein [Frisingicoccus sp.]|uniref:hypothetical protein n=1 Tax=Frisingicoccus sp. TaxID=1918627 RepID=UPI003AB10AD9